MSDLFLQSRSKSLSKRLILWAIIPITFYSVAWFKDVPFQEVSRDPADLYNYHPLVGVLSNIGLLLWMTTAAVLFFSANLIREFEMMNEARRTLIRFGLMSVIFLLDDLLLLHEQVVPQNLGISEKLTYMLYGAVFLAFMWRSRRTLLQADSPALGAALACFALSVGLDVFPNWLPRYHYALEDTPKFVGIGMWATFFLSLARDTVVAAFSRHTRSQRDGLRLAA
jgi:hypothetical protein